MQFIGFRIIMNRLRVIPYFLKDRTVPKRKKALVIFGIVYLFLPINWPPLSLFFADDIILWIFIIWHLKDDLDIYWKGDKNEDLSKKFRDKDIVDGVEFTVVDGGKKDDDKNDKKGE
jgi:uncharacterized membrane protein YkvA (DUF1232 family)